MVWAGALGGSGAKSGAEGLGGKASLGNRCGASVRFGDRSGAESDGFGVVEANVQDTGAKPERFGGKVVRNRSSLRQNRCGIGVVNVVTGGRKNQVTCGRHLRVLGEKQAWPGISIEETP
jgi:hypothetical protein